MSIYGNLFINESNTFDLDSFNTLLEEDINFEAMFNEACTINILTEAIDMKTIKEKIKSIFKKIIEKIGEFLKKIREFIKHIKDKIIKVVFKKKKEELDEVMDKAKETKSVKTESVSFLNESEYLNSETIVFQYETIERFYIASCDYFIKYLVDKFNTNDLEKSNKNVKYYLGTLEIADLELSFLNKDKLNRLFDFDANTGFPTRLHTVKQAIDWYDAYIADNKLEKTITKIVKEVELGARAVEKIKKELEDLEKDTESKLARYNNNDSFDNIASTYKNNENINNYISKIKEAIGLATRVIDVSKLLNTGANMIINALGKDMNKVESAVRRTLNLS